MKGRILAHRGHWSAPEEKNQPVALERALVAGYGIETDIRDLDGTLVISHDPASSAERPMPVEAFFELYRSLGSDGWLALNIKADGLSKPLKAMLDRARIGNAFVFDMSVPETRNCLAAQLRVFTRRSDIEPHPPLLERSEGIWLDCFEIPHAPAAWAWETMAAGRVAALVSPELHRRAHLEAWSEWRAAIDFGREPLAMLCTDLPDMAYSFFAERA